jgi:hypothetical protein
VDLWAAAEASVDGIVALFRRVWALSDVTIADLDLDAPGTVPWWGDRGAVTLQHVLVQFIDETSRHAGHADIVRELVDGVVG